MSPFVNSVNEKKPFIYDFVSDTATIPTEDMFDVMKLATCGDDVFQVIRLTHIFKLFNLTFYQRATMTVESWKTTLLICLAMKQPCFVQVVQCQIN